MVKALRCDHEFVKLAWKGHEYGFFDYNIRKVEWFSTKYALLLMCRIEWAYKILYFYMKKMYNEKKKKGGH